MEMKYADKIEVLNGYMDVAHTRKFIDVYAFINIEKENAGVLNALD